MVEPLPPLPPKDRDWPTAITDKVVSVVEQVRVNTTKRAITVARLVVFGTVALVVGLVAFTLLLIGLFRMVDGYLPGHVWSAYLLFGGIFTVLGLLLFTRRKPVAAPADN